VTGKSTVRRVFLVGFMGAGKSTVGKKLAGRLGWSFYDLDRVIERREGKSIARIFAGSGENAFRRMESAALRELLQRSEDDCIIALGGGAFTRLGNRRALERAGAITILLNAPVEELERRCRAAGRTRPLSRNKARFKHLFTDRQQAYSLAQFCVETDKKEIAEVAEEIERILGIG
jgi:shikimate kinase